MAKTYVELETLEELLRENGCYFLLEELNTVSAGDIVKDMSSFDLSQALDEKDDVFATQVWRREDIEATIRRLTDGQSTALLHDDVLIEEIMKEGKVSLENCSDNWNLLYHTVKKCIERRGNR